MYVIISLKCPMLTFFKKKRPMSTFFVKHVDIFENIEVNVNIYSKTGLEKGFFKSKC